MIKNEYLLTGEEMMTAFVIYLARERGLVLVNDKVDIEVCYRMRTDGNPAEARVTCRQKEAGE